MTQEELVTWLIARCEEQNLSWTEASRRAGISPNAISEIVNGTPAGVKRLSAIADFFGVSREYLFRLAGHLPLRRSRDQRDPRIQATAEKLLEIWDRLAEIDPDALDDLLNIVVMQAAMVEASANAARRRIETKETEPETAQT